MIFAKLDVTIRGHKRAKKAGAAMGTWTWGLAYIRDQESDGFIPDYMISDCFVGETQGRKDAAKLVAAGLWDVILDGQGPDGEGGWRMCRYEEKNETKAQIDSRRLTDRVRKTPKPEADSDSNSNTIPTGSAGGFPGSDSGSGSDLGSSRSEEPPKPPREAPPPPPSWPHNDVAKGTPPCRAPVAEVDHGEVTSDLPLLDDARAKYASYTAVRHLDTSVDDAWLAFVGHHAGQRYGSRDGVLGKFQLWLTKQAKLDDVARGRRRESEERSARWDAERAAKVPGNGAAMGYCAPAVERPEPTAAEVAETKRLAAGFSLDAIFPVNDMSQTGTE